MSKKTVSAKSYFPVDAVLVPDSSAVTEFAQENQARIAIQDARTAKVTEVAHRVAAMARDMKALTKELDKAKVELKRLTVNDTDYQVGDSRVCVYTVTGRTFNVPKLRSLITPELFTQVTRTSVDTKAIDKAFEAGMITVGDMVEVVEFKDSKSIKVVANKKKAETA